MGSLKEKLKQRWEQSKRERAGNKAFQRHIEKQAEIAERQSYAKGRIARAKTEGYRKGRTAQKSGTLGTLSRLGANFAAAGEELAALPPSMTRTKKKKKSNDPLDWMF